MSRIATLVAELEGDPGTYATMTDEQVASSLNEKNISVNVDSVERSTIIEAVDLAELDALTALEVQKFQIVITPEQVDPFGWAAGLLVGIFGGGSATIANLIPLRKKDISRAEQLGYTGVVKVGHVEMARAKMV